MKIKDDLPVGVRITKPKWDRFTHWVSGKNKWELDLLQKWSDWFNSNNKPNEIRSSGSRKALYVYQQWYITGSKNI